MLGARIAALRRRDGLSQAQLAKQLQVSASAVGMYEQGRREPGAQILVELARIFSVSTDYLLTGQPRTEAEAQAAGQLLLHSLAEAQLHLESREKQPFTRQELAALFAAMLTEA